MVESRTFLSIIKAVILCLNKNMIEITYGTPESSLYTPKFQLLDNFVED